MYDYDMGFFWLVAAYEITVRLDIESRGVVPRFHMGSLDGTLLWAILIETTPDTFLHFKPPKMMQMMSIILGLMTGYEPLPSLVHYLRRAHLLFSFFVDVTNLDDRCACFIVHSRPECCTGVRCLLLHLTAL
jgi:hypothetical protein